MNALDQLPSHATLVASSDVWMEGDAISQLAHAAGLAGCIRAVGMPDLHPGPGGNPIGVALALRDRIIPQLLGSDIGCGVSLVVTNVKRKPMDGMERSVRETFSDTYLPWQLDTTVLPRLLHRGLRGLSDVDGLPPSLQALAAAAPEEHSIRLSDADTSDLVAGDIHRMTLGTMGGGNHFAEVSCVREIRDASLAAQHGITLGTIAVLVHSGSRSLGKTISDRYGTRSFTSDDADEYLSAHAWACQFARANRFLLTWRLLSALGAARLHKISLTVDRVHNDVSASVFNGHPVWLHRKGAAAAPNGEPTVVLGSRGSPSWIVLGTGDERSLFSVAHGAGRRMTRAEAIGKLKDKYHRDALVRTRHGGRVICDRKALLYEEHPDAYKPIEPVVESLVHGGLARQIATLEPLITVKQ